MDCNNTAVFAKEYRRMCKSFAECRKCPMYEHLSVGQMTCSIKTLDYIDDIIPVVQKWSDENPMPPTRQSIAMKLFPDLKLDSRGISRVCPMSILENALCPMNHSDCFKCCEDYWMQEIDPDSLFPPKP